MRTSWLILLFVAGCRLLTEASVQPLGKQTTPELTDGGAYCQQIDSDAKAINLFIKICNTKKNQHTK